MWSTEHKKWFARLRPLGSEGAFKKAPHGYFKPVPATAPNQITIDDDDIVFSK